MQLEFYKYQGTGNDFILVDNRTDFFPKKNSEMVSRLCHRRFGIGADGLILLEKAKGADFYMHYYNSDGHPGSMCGNGGRCIVAFSKFLGLIRDECTFLAVDGIHTATIESDVVCLRMNDVKEIRLKPNYVFLNTGSPHHVQLVEGLDQYDVKGEGERLRYGLYGKKGSNINFVERQAKNEFKVRTYERGVEDETLSCGTGVTAVALAMHRLGKTQKTQVGIITPGGHLQVMFEKDQEGYRNIYLKGRAQMVFKGTFDANA
jgi:diaminopimelate epimerase